MIDLQAIFRILIFFQIFHSETICTKRKNNFLEREEITLRGVVSVAQAFGLLCSAFCPFAG